MRHIGALHRRRNPTTTHLVAVQPLDTALAAPELELRIFLRREEWQPNSLREGLDLEARQGFEHGEEANGASRDGDGDAGVTRTPQER